MQHARREPDIPILRLAPLYGVDKTTLGRRVKGKQGTQADARRDDQLFSPGEVNAIIDHCDMMGKLGFPISKSMLVRLAQDMLNQRPMDLSSLRHLIKGTASTATAGDVNIEISTLGQLQSLGCGMGRPAVMAVKSSLGWQG